MSTTPDLKDKKEFMAIKQLTKRPIHCLPYRRERFEGFCMVDKKLVSAHDIAPSVFSGLERLP